MPNGTLSDSRNVEVAKQCLRMIRDIADRGANSWNPDHVNYALQELSQVLLERTGTEERYFEPEDTAGLDDLSRLRVELDFVNGLSESMAISDRN